jgi:hypothetical protein
MSRTYRDTKAAQQAYDARNHDRRLAQKRRWWPAHKGQYGTREEYLAVMRATGGMGFTGREGRGQDVAAAHYGRERWR